MSGGERARHGRGKGTRGAVLALSAALGLAGCLDDADPLRPEGEAGGELLARYVSLGNSVTAGFQSAGINELTQAQAYPVLIAEQAGVEFGVPALEFPGCPPPLEQVLPARRIGGLAGDFCLLRQVPPARRISNFAVPGAELADAIDNLIPESSANALTTLILGGRTQVGAMLDADPTLVSVWLGNNELLGAALSGNAAAATPLPVFQAGLDSLAQAIEATPARDAILIGAADVTSVPALQPGVFAWAIRGQLAALGFEVSSDCAPGTPGAGNLLSLSLLFDGSVSSVSCADSAPYVLTPAEVGTLLERVAQFNAAVQAVAAARGWIYFDPNPTFDELLADPDLVRKCQGLAAARTPQEFAAAVEATCPNPDAPNFFGAAFSLDGVHPSALTHRRVANALIGLLNEKHGLEIPMIDVL